MRFDNVLVTTDFSGNSKAALELAAYSAKIEGSKLTVVTVVEDWEVPTAIQRQLPSPELVKNYREDIVNSTKKKLQELWKECSHDQEANLVVLLRKTSVAEEITNYAKDNKCNVIVISSHGRTAVGDFVLGSIVRKVIRFSEQPVLVVPKKS